MVGVRGYPFGVVVSPDGRWAFVSTISSVDVFRAGSSLAFSLVRTLPVPGQAVGETLTHDGRLLLAASGRGAVVIDVARAESGSPHAILGTLADPGGGGAIEVAVTPGNRFAFVSLEGSADIAVFNLQRALSSGFGRSEFVGTIPVGLAPVGMAVSPDGRWLYATSELARPARGAQPSPGAFGTLSVIDVRRAESQPARSVVATVLAGCSPVRVITSAGGSIVWVTARGSDALLAFSAPRLHSDPPRALIAAVRVGEAPVGLALARNGTRIVVADSNRFGVVGAASSLAIVSAPAALAGRPAVLGLVRAGQFPREMALELDGKTLLVTNFASSQVEAVSTGDLP
jgi:DNA-binding beta-propeller fold protein YncE